MSDSVTNFGGTLTGGIQDISALLPLIGTEQCEKHVGSALEGGFLYAAATPLSLFGSLGIVRAGISVLVASISIPKLSLSLPKLSFSKGQWWFKGISIPIPSLKFTPLPKLSLISSRPLLRGVYKYKLKLSPPKLSFTSSRRLWCGARVLDNAGFKLVGRVAPLIGMDEKRYKAESRLIEILEEKHIDTPEKLSIDWRSADWNISLVIGTIVAALISGTPYLYLLLKDPPNSIHSPWVFPFLRTIGSCLATVCCQFLLQSRVISLMKSRIVFMIMHRLLVDDLKKGNGNQAESILKEQKWFLWDESFPAEECLWSLEHYLPSNPKLPRSLLKQHLLRFMQLTLFKVRVRGKDLEENSFRGSHTDWVDVQYSKDSEQVSIQSVPSEPLFSDPNHILSTLAKQRAEHFPTPCHYRIFIIASWFLLLVSLPAAVVGYIGCFTIVTNSHSPGPLVWLGLEAALSAFRILLWAWNPTFDEKTEVEVKLKLTREQPLVTTPWDFDVLRSLQWPLLPERRFLEQITPYTGPLVQFKSPDNTALYFVFTVNKERTRRRLFMTVLDLTNRAAFTLYYSDISGDTRSSQDLVYATTLVTPDTDSGEMLASIQWDSAVNVEHPRRINIPIHDLAKYYNSLLHSLTRSNSIGSTVASLPWRWSLVAKESEDDIQSQVSEVSTPTNLTEHEHLCLQQSYEHHLKTRLMEIWGKWIVDDVEAMYRDRRNDCYLALADPISNKAKRKLYAFNVVLVQEWTKRELAHLQLSAALEIVLRANVQQNAKKLERKISFSLEMYDLQKQRLEYERAQVKVRWDDMMKTIEQNELASIWQAGQTFVEEKWTAAIERGSFEEGFLEVTTEHILLGHSDDEMCTSVEQLKPRFSHWNDQHSYERREMEATLERISKADAKQLEQAYEYPDSSTRLAAHIHSNFLCLLLYGSETAIIAKLSSATVYDVYMISTIDVIRTVAEKSSCRSLINVDRELIRDIPDNDHLLFCSEHGNREVDLPFIQRNRNRWWTKQRTNSWTFYLSPQLIDPQYVYSYRGTIARIMIFLQTPTHLRLHLLHCRIGDLRLSVQQEGKELHLIHPAEIPEGKLRLQDYNLDHQFEPGQHELQLVVSMGCYNLRDIGLEFVNDPLSGTITSNLT